MELKDIYTKLKTLNIPVAYHHFKKSSDLKVPFCVYYLDNRERYGSDFKNMLERRSITIELYTETKDITLENKLYALFDSFDFEVSETYISEERLYMNTISFETIIKI